VCDALPNSTGQAPILSINGSACVQQDHVAALVRNCPPGTTAIGVLGTPAAAVPFANGVLCLAAPFVRTHVVQADAMGSFTVDLSPSTLPVVIQPGETVGFQFLFRDAETGPYFVNTTGAQAITFGP
jgi:hypothetical protein